MTYERFKSWYEDLPLLTYGELTDEYVLDSFQLILLWKSQGVFISEDIPDNTFTVTEYWLFLSVLNDCIEYGSSPRGAWLTDFGKELLKFLQTGQHLPYLQGDL